MAADWQQLVERCVVVTAGVVAIAIASDAAQIVVFGGDAVGVPVATWPGTAAPSSVPEAWLAYDGRAIPLVTFWGMGGPPRMLHVSMPTVRLRSDAQLVVAVRRHGARHLLTSTSATLLPKDRLGGAQGRLEALALGVFDPTGELKRMLEDDGIRYVNLPNRDALDWFEGRVLLIGPDAMADRGDDLMASLAGRVADGLHVIVMYQDQAWTGLGVQCVESKSTTGPVWFAGDLCGWDDSLRPVDFDTSDCPTRLELTPGDAGATNDIWHPWMIMDSPRGPACVAGWMRRSAGSVCVLQLPQTACVTTSPVGYTLCAIAILEAAARAERDDPLKEERQ